MRSLRLLAALSWIAASSGAVGNPVGPQNLVLITLDTTRADHLGPYGAEAHATPVLDRIAAESVVFEHAVSVAPLTLPAHTSILTGLLPTRHGVRDNADVALSSDHVTLAEILRARGFRTAATVGSIVLGHERGLAQGFDVYRAPAENSRPPRPTRRADEVIGEAVAWLKSSTRPFFLWVHLYDPHAPYDPPEPYRSTFVADPYAGEIAFMDAQIGRLLDTLDLRSTAVVVGADHGEALGEHGEEEHGLLLYDGVMRVPLLVRAPGLPARRIMSLVRQVDVFPTALELLGIAAPASDGVSLVPMVRNAGGVPPLVGYSESMFPRRFGWAPLRSTRDERFKYIDGPKPELYDLIVDPAEQHNLFGSRRALAASMHARFAAIDSPTPASGSPVPPALVAQLASLGYVAPTATTTDVRAPDPKEHVDAYNHHVAASRLRNNEPMRSSLLEKP